MSFKNKFDDMGLSTDQQARILKVSRTAIDNYRKRKRDVPLRIALVLLQLNKGPMGKKSPEISEEKREIIKFLEGLLAVK